VKHKSCWAIPALAAFVEFAEASVVAHHAGVQGPPYPPDRRKSTRAVFTCETTEQTHLRSSQMATEQSSMRSFLGKFRFWELRNTLSRSREYY